MTSAHEPVLHALSVEPRVARPGETVCVIFRTRNLGTSASPPGTVVFLLGDGLEAVGEAAIAVGSVAPGDDVIAMVDARVAAPLDDRTELAVQAALHVPDAVLGTNVCAVLVRSRAVLDGDASGTFVELVDADTVRVRAVVTNEGDGAARDVRIDVPAPAGCSRVNADAPSVLELERLEAGASVTATFEARIVAPVTVLQAEDGEVRFGGGQRSTLPVRAVVVMEPVLAAPVVTVHPARRSVDVAIDVRNDGWVDARDVRVRIALPAPLRAIDGSIVADGVPVAARAGRRRSADQAFARVERSGGAYIVVVTVTARSVMRIAATATFLGGWAGGTIVAGAGAHEIAVPFVPELARDVRMRLVETPRTVVAGDEVRVRAEIVNAGDVTEQLFFCIAGPGLVVAPEALSTTVAPGAVVAVEFAVRVHETVPNDGPLRLSAVVCDTERERARSEFVVVVRDRIGPCSDNAPACDEERMPAVVHPALHGPDEVSAGVPFLIRLDIDVEDAVETLVVRVREVAGASYVSGSTSLDRRSLVDRGGTSPLARDGLVLRGVPSGARVTAEWALLPNTSVCDEALVVDAVLEVDGEERTCAPIAVSVRGRDAFAAQPAGFAYHVDAFVVETAADIAPVAKQSVSVGAVAAESVASEAMMTPAPALDAVPVEFGDDAFTFGMRLDGERVDELVRLMSATAGDGLVPHVFALRALFPAHESSHDPVVASALDRARCALHEVLDRLFVKLRIPGFAVAADDVDDVELREAMTGFLERLRCIASGAGCDDGATTRITRERAGELLAGFEGAPYGAPAALRALVAFVPTRCATDPLLSAALARYACTLDDVFARYEGVPLELFDVALARFYDHALDDARSALATALQARASFAELAC